MQPHWQSAEIRSSFTAKKRNGTAEATLRQGGPTELLVIHAARENGSQGTCNAYWLRDALEFLHIENVAATLERSSNCLLSCTEAVQAG